jgi:hypothetical protein
MPTITDLPKLLAALPEEAQRRFHTIYRVEQLDGRAIVPEPMRDWVTQRFGSVAAAERQTVIKVLNWLTLEGALFNPLRSRRIAAHAANDAELEQWIAEELAMQTMFRDPQRLTTDDPFGRVRGRWCTSASNVAKYDGLHGLIVFDEPHPLHFNTERLQDYLATALRWLAAAHTYDPQAIYPVITWNCLPKSGATIMHGHMQMVLSRTLPFARAELWRRAAAVYAVQHPQRDYYTDLAELHTALGLDLPAPPGVSAFAHLTPLRAHEIVAMVQPPGTTPETWLPAIAALGEFLGTSLERLQAIGTRTFNMALLCPPIGTHTEWRNTPLVLRLGDRGDPLGPRGDLGSMELYATGVIGVDPFETRRAVRRTEN